MIDYLMTISSFATELKELVLIDTKNQIQIVKSCII